MVDSLDVVAEVELKYIQRSSTLPKVDSSRSAYTYLLKGWNQNFLTFIEEFKVLLLSRANRALGIYSASRGGRAGTVADPALIFAAAIKANASSIIVAHNHPSGSLSPSQSDRDLTKRLVQGGQVLNIQVVDHLILAGTTYFSFADEGLI